MSSKWQRTGITKDLMKDFFVMFDTTPRKVQFSEGQVSQVKLSDIIPKNHDWYDTMWRYEGLMMRLDKKCKEFTDCAWWKHEKKNQVRDIQKRLDRFKILYQSIKNSSYKYMKKDHVKLLDLRDVTRKNPVKGGRISDMYYRLNGMKRVLACAYLGINKIPCRVYGVSV